MFFGTYDVRSHPRVGVLAAGLSRHGLDVRQLNAPLGIGTAGRVAVLRQPWRLPGFAWALLSRWASLARRARRLRGAAAPDVVVVGYLGHFDVLLARRLFPRSRIVLDHLIGASDTALDRGESGSLKQRLLRGLDEAALASADVVVVDTEEHLATLPEEHRGRGVVVAVGAPDAWFAQAAAPAPDHASALRVVFFGLFTPLQGAPVVGRALALLAGTGVEATLYGIGQELAATRAAAAGARGVTWQDWAAAEDLPRLVAAADVCLGIFGTGPKALRVVPNKVFQGAAAGCAVVTSDTGPQRRMLGDAAVLVPPGDAAALAAALRALAADRTLLERQKQAARALAERAFRPERVVVPLVEVLTGRLDGGGLEGSVP
nr:glycosyltransferase [Motilibacter aurantiacus]